MRHFRLYLCLALSGLALSATTAGAHPWRAHHGVCYPVASWVTIPPNVCIKYVCAGGPFHIRCLPAPVLH